MKRTLIPVLFALCVTAVVVPLALEGLDAWTAWEAPTSLNVKADQSAIVCAICAVIGVLVTIYMAWVLTKIKNQGR